MDDSNAVPGPVRWAIATWSEDSPRGAVTAFCAAHGISRSVFYKIRAQARELGEVAACEPRSRRPVTSPARTGQEVIDQALSFRAKLERLGVDAGPLSVVDRMRRAGLRPPSRATLARAFLAAGVVVPEPAKKPRSAYQRFVYPAPNDCWQIDAFDWHLAGGKRCVVFQVIDDHSRLALATLAAPGETSAAAIEAVGIAIRRWGVPVRFLSDNGRALNPWRQGHLGKLALMLQDLGVHTMTSRPGRPTTQGKDERFHRTLHKWLNARPAARDLDQLQWYCQDHDDYYNHHRGHQALAGMMTPWETWQATPLADPPCPPGPRLPAPAMTPRPAPSAGALPGTGQADKTVTAMGRISILGAQLALGRQHAGALVHVIWDHTSLEVFDDQGASIRRLPRPPAGAGYIGLRRAGLNS